MFAAAFRPLRRHDPESVLKIDLSNCRSACFSASRSSQNRKGERFCRNGILLRQFLEELWQVLIGHRLVVLYGPDLTPFGKQLIQMAAPTRWVLTASEIMRGCQIQRGF